MVLSVKFYEVLYKLEKKENWTALPDDHPEIQTLRAYANNGEEYDPEKYKRKSVALYRHGELYKEFNTAAEAAKVLGVNPSAVQKAARGETRYCKGFKVEYTGG